MTHWHAQDLAYTMATLLKHINITNSDMPLYTWNSQNARCQIHNKWSKWFMNHDSSTTSTTYLWQQYPYPRIKSIVQSVSYGTWEHHLSSSVSKWERYKKSTTLCMCIWHDRLQLLLLWITTKHECLPVITTNANCRWLHPRQTRLC